jgi:hypothetical protein
MDQVSKSNILYYVSAVALGALLKYFFDRRRESASLLAKSKGKMYEGYVNTILDFHLLPSTTDPTEQQKRNDKFLKDTQAFQRRYMLTASPGVIRAIKRQLQFYERNQNKIVNPRKENKKNTVIFKQMRRDIGTSNWTLGRTAGVLMSPILMYRYEPIMHPIKWKTKQWVQKSLQSIFKKKNK